MFQPFRVSAAWPDTGGDMSDMTRNERFEALITEGTLRFVLDQALTEAEGKTYWYDKLDALETAVGDWLVGDGFIDALYDALGDDTGLTFPVRRDQVAAALAKAAEAAPSTPNPPAEK